MTLPEREFMILGDRERVTAVKAGILRRLEEAADPARVAALHRAVDAGQPLEVLAGEDVVSLWLGDQLLATTGWLAPRRK